MQDHEEDYRDPLFKGCTRPAMALGVPLAPLIAVSVTILIISLWINFFIAIALIPTILVMRQIAKSDDQNFRLIGLKLLFRFVNKDRNNKFWKASSYSPIEFTKRI